MRAKEETLLSYAFPKSLPTLLDRVGGPASPDADGMPLYLGAKTAQGGIPKCAWGDRVCGADSPASCLRLPTPLGNPIPCLGVPTCPKVGMGLTRRTLEEVISLLGC